MLLSNLASPTTSTLPPLLKGGAFFIDNSTYDWLLTCERGAYYKILHRRESAGKASALHFGGAIHAGLELRYKRGGFAFDSLGDQQCAAREYLVNHPIDSGDWRTPDLACDTLTKYASTYPVEDFDIVKVGDRPLVELPFAVPLGTVELPQPITVRSTCGVADVFNTSDELIEVALSETTKEREITVQSIPVIWTGKIDLVINRSGRLWLADHKTTSIFGPTYFEQFNLAGQFSGYKFALMETLNQPIDGVMINCIANRKPTKSGTGFDAARQYLPIPDYQVHEWRENTLRIISEFFSALAHGYFPMRTCSCRTKWQRACEYLGVCTLPPEQREMYLYTGDYKPVEWSPLKED